MRLFKKKHEEKKKPAKTDPPNRMCCPECADTKYPCVKMERQIKKSSESD